MRVQYVEAFDAKGNFFMVQFTGTVPVPVPVPIGAVEEKIRLSQPGQSLESGLQALRYYYTTSSLYALSSSYYKQN
jgi:hypothetical protein